MEKAEQCQEQLRSEDELIMGIGSDDSAIGVRAYMSQEERLLQNKKIDQLERLIHKVEWLIVTILCVGGLALILLAQSKICSNN